MVEKGELVTPHHSLMSLHDFYFLRNLNFGLSFAIIVQIKNKRLKFIDLYVITLNLLHFLNWIIKRNELFVNSLIYWHQLVYLC